MSQAQKTGLIVLLAAFLVALLAPSMPAIRPYPGRDSGVFLYAGWRILAGDLPYRDVWDHKPPAILYLNALGLLLGGGSMWGVWLLELLALGAAALLGYALLRRAFGPLAAAFGTALWLLSLTAVLEWGNFTEEYALPCQFLALYAFQDAETRGRYTWQGYAIGISGALAFLLRPNLVGAWVAIVLYLALSRARGRGRSLLYPLATMGAGLAVLGVVAAYFAAHGALAELWDCVFRYGLAYARTGPGAGPVERQGASVAGLYNLSSTGLSIAGVAGWFSLLARKLQRDPRAEPGDAWLDALLLALPLELFFIVAAGRRYPHYYMAWLPSLAILGTYLFVAVAPGPAAEGKRPAPNALLLLSFCLAAAFLPAEKLRASLGELTRVYGPPPVVAYIERASAPDDYVLIWGAETGINFVTHRRSPTRFVYQYPLFTPGYRSGALVREFLGDLQSHPPILIVDTSPTNSEVPSLAVGSAVAASRAELLLPEMDEVFAFIAARYEPVPDSETGAGPWRVYRLKEARP